MNHPFPIRIQSVGNSVMQPVWLSLPELHTGGFHSEPTPKIRSGDGFILIFSIKVFPLLHKDFIRGQGLTLGRYPGRQLTPAGTGLLKYLLDSFSDNLTTFPSILTWRSSLFHQNTNAAAGFLINSFPASVIGEKNETIFIKAFQ